MTGNIKCILNLQFLFVEYSERFYNKINLFLFFFCERIFGRSGNTYVEYEFWG